MQYLASLAWYVPWTTLRSVGNSYAVRLTVLIPLVGYLLIFNDTVLRYVALATAFGDPAAPSHPNPAPVPVRLLLIYLGLCAFAVGSVLYALCCPPEIKTYPTAAAYVGGDGPHLGDVVIGSIEEFLRAHEPESYGEIRDRYDWDPIRHGPRSESDRAEAKQQSNNAFLHLEYTILDDLRPFIRVATAFFFGLGFVLLAIPSAMIFWKALGILWRSLT